MLQKVDFNPYEELFVKLPEIFHTEGDLETTYILIDKCKTAFDDYLTGYSRRQQKQLVRFFHKKESRVVSCG